VAGKGVGVGVMSGSRTVSQANVANIKSKKAAIILEFIGFILSHFIFCSTLDKRPDLCYHVTITLKVEAC
jgi:hypothetical protein